MVSAQDPGKARPRRKLRPYPGPMFSSWPPSCPLPPTPHTCPCLSCLCTSSLASQAPGLEFSITCINTAASPPPLIPSQCQASLGLPRLPRSCPHSPGPLLQPRQTPHLSLLPRALPDHLSPHHLQPPPTAPLLRPSHTHCKVAPVPGSQTFCQTPTHAGMNASPPGPNSP